MASFFRKSTFLLLALTVSFTTGSLPLIDTASEECRNLGESWEPLLNSMFDKFNENYTHPTKLPKFGLPFGKASLMNGSLFGLGGLRPDRPYLFFCRRGEQVATFSLFANDYIYLEYQWSSACLLGNNSGYFFSDVADVRLEGEVVKTNATTAPELKHLRIVELDSPTIILGGLGSTANRVAQAVTSFFLTGPMKGLWKNMLLSIVKPTLSDLVQSMENF